MNDAAPRHPEAQTMAAFVEGKLAPAELAEVAQHLRDCGDCRTVVSETARFQREEEESKQTPITRPWLLAVAAILAAIAITIPILRWNATRNSPASNPSPIARLIAVAPHDHRVVEARLSGFPWARMQAPSRGDTRPDPADLKVAGAAGEVLEATAAQQQPESRRATGVAYLLIGSRNDSIAALEQAARNSTDARAWNDLAAARFAVATEDEHLSQLPEALADADHALHLNAKFPEALFNRALIIEHLGDRERAREAWKRYLNADPNSAWSVEARGHLRALESSVRRFDPKMLETMPADALVREFPQEARTWGEGPMLAEWADAAAAHDEAHASKTLAQTRSIADALERFNGEHLLDDAVTSINHSTALERRALIDAHRLYRDARIEHSVRNSGSAEVKFARAAALFQEGGSAMAEMARYYGASAAFSEHRGAEARDRFQKLRVEIDVSRHRALGALIQRSLAVAANADGDWGAGVRSAHAAASTFQSLGERANAASVNGIAADAFDMIGGGDQAWSHRVQSYAILSTVDRVPFLRSAATALDRFGRSEGAAAMIGLAIEDLRHDPAQLAAALTDQARFADRNNDAAGARHALTAAQAAADGVHDAAWRETISASIGVVDAALIRNTEPHKAIATLDKAVDFFAEGHLRPLLPDAYLERARAHHAAGDERAALADYAAALREIDAQRNMIGNADLRLRFLDTATIIIEESIDLHLAQGMVAEAFRLADRQREMPETEALSAASGDATRLTPGTAVIEYVVLPHSIAIFCLSVERLTVEKVIVERWTLAPRITSLAEKIRSRAPLDQIRTEAAALHRLLIEPLQSQLAHVNQIVIIPDHQLYAVPFAALYDNSSREYLIERFTIRFVPSASAAAESANEALHPALVAADPQTRGWPSLPGSREEGERIAAIHSATLMTGPSATRDRFLEAVKGSALIHYAGHADSDVADSYAALLFAAKEGDSGILSSSDIAQLKLAKRPLVVLAACGTFRGDPLHAAGMSSVVRGFLLAGARAVIGTLWEVDDDVAPPIFLSLHKHLHAGVSPASALRKAQMEMLSASDARLQHPATWAPVEITQQSSRRMSWTQ